MKKKYNLTGIICLTIHLLFFYLLPLFAGPTDTMGLISVLLIVSFVLSFIVGLWCTYKVKYFYPIIVVIIFLPTIFIYYNNSSMLYLLFNFIMSILGLAIGLLIRQLLKKNK